MGVKLVLAGRLRRDTLLPPSGRPLIDVPGGDLLYTASGCAVWGQAPGLLGRVGEDYPHEWLQDLQGRGFGTAGIRVVTDPLDLRYFQAALDLDRIQTTNPVAHFARLGLPFPKSLLGYQPGLGEEDDRRSFQPASPRPADIPADYLEAHAVHYCPLDYLTVNRLSSTFSDAGATTQTLDPAPAMLVPEAVDDLRLLLRGLTACLPSEGEIKALFWGRTNDLWQMAEELGSWGCEFIVIQRGMRGQLLYDSVSRKKWDVPAYPGRPTDLTGTSAAFCGGFLAGYLESYDPLQGVLCGNVSASLTAEGSGAFHALESLPGLSQARLGSLRSLVRSV
jgi:ribokinase